MDDSGKLSAGSHIVRLGQECAFLTIKVVLYSSVVIGSALERFSSVRVVLECVRRCMVALRPPHGTLSVSACTGGMLSSTPRP